MGWWGSLRDISKNIFKQGVGKGKSQFVGGEVLKVSPPLPPGKLLIIHQSLGLGLDVSHKAIHLLLFYEHEIPRGYLLYLYKGVCV